MDDKEQNYGDSKRERSLAFSAVVVTLSAAAIISMFTVLLIIKLCESFVN